MDADAVVTRARVAGGAMATYVYCLLRSGRRPAPRGIPRGLAGTGPVRFLEAGQGLWVVVAHAPLARYGAEPVERSLRDLDWVSRCAVAHEAVVEHVARTGPVIPMKIFTLFADDARALDHLRAIRTGVERVFERVAGREEWSVRVWFDEARARKARAGPVHAGPPAASGTEFLLAKKRQQEAVRELRQESRAEIDRVFEELAVGADDARRRTPVPGDEPARLLLDAVFLVPARQVPALRARVRRLTARLGARGYEVRLSGPWPPYNFVSEAT